MSRDADSLVKVASAGNQAIGEMWREALVTNGIPAMLRIAGPLTAYASFTSPHELFVRAADVERAREFLAAYNEDEGDLSLGRGSNADFDDEYWMEGAEDEDDEKRGR